MRDSFTRSLRALALLGLMLSLALVVACGGDDDADDESAGNAADWSAQAIDATQRDSDVLVGRVGSVPGVGPNRLVFFVMDHDGNLIHNAEATARIYRLEQTPDGGRSGTLVTEAELQPATIREDLEHTHADGTVHVHDDPLATVYHMNADLDAVGDWGAELDVTVDGKHYNGLREAFIVIEDSTEPSVGDPIPPTRQQTLADVDDISLLSTADPPNPEMHDVTVADALELNRPLVIAFATPEFCQTRFCGPILDEVVRPLEERFADEVEFIHIEPFYLDPERRGQFVVVPEMEEWGLRSEPWVMIVGPDGRLAAKFEGITDLEEVGAALERVVAGDLPYAANID